jgi:hypothetical protein
MYTKSLAIIALPGGYEVLFTHRGVTVTSTFSFVGYCRARPLSEDFQNGIETYGVLVELGVQFYGLYVWYFALVSVCLPLHILTSLYTRFPKQIYLHVVNSFYSHIQTPIPG